MIQVTAAVKPLEVPFRRRYNFKKANWREFKILLDKEIIGIEPDPKNYLCFINLVQTISRKCIPRGCSQATLNKLRDYNDMYESDPFAEETIALGEEVMQDISGAKREEWKNVVEGIDMKNNSYKARKLLRKLNSEKVKQYEHINVKPNEIARQLVLNGKTKNKSAKIKIQRSKEREVNHFQEPFRTEELDEAISMLKARKAAGVDDILSEQIKQFGPKTKEWLLEMFNKVVRSKVIPKEWR